MKALLQSYNTFLRGRWLLPRSIEYYEWHITHFFQYTWSKVSDFWDLKKFRERYNRIIDRESLCNESKKKHLKCARIFADFLIQEEIIKYNAPRDIKPPRVQTSLPIPVEDENIDTIFSAINRRWSWFLRERNTMIINLFLYTGLRRGELLSLRREHINEERIFVRSWKWNKDRTVYIPQHFSSLLDDYMRKTHGVSEYLFFTGQSEKMSESTIKRVFQEIKKITKIEKLYPHKLRHTYATRMLEQNIDLAVVRDQMGHASISTTNRYIAVRDKHRREAVQNLQF